MSFVVPNLNLLGNIFTGTGPLTLPSSPPVGPPRLASVPCALVYGRRVNVQSTGGTASPGFPYQGTNLLVGKGTDLRGEQDALTGMDVVEVPAGSGQWYACTWVLDIGKGWSNEHRSGSLQPIPGTWIPPYA